MIDINTLLARKWVFVNIEESVRHIAWFGMCEHKTDELVATILDLRDELVRAQVYMIESEEYIYEPKPHIANKDCWELFNNAHYYLGTRVLRFLLLDNLEKVDDDIVEINKIVRALGVFKYAVDRVIEQYHLDEYFDDDSDYIDIEDDLINELDCFPWVPWNETSVEEYFHMCMERED